MQVNWKEVCQCAGYKSLKAAYISAGDLAWCRRYQWYTLEPLPLTG